jgi:hypothetical protein
MVLEHPLSPGPTVLLVSELDIGDLLFDGSQTQAGEPNLLVVTELRGARGEAAGPDRFQGHFVSLLDPAEKRLPSDQTFAVWDFKLQEGAYRRAVTGPWPKPPGPLGRVSPLAT